MRDNVFYPLFRRQLLQKQHVAKLIERHIATLEDATHQVFLTSKQAIGRQLLVLPYGT